VDPQPGEEPDRAAQEADAGQCALVAPHLGVGEPRGVIHGDMQVLPADSAHAGSAIAVNAVPDPTDPAELHVDVHQLARVLALVADHWTWKLRRAQATLAGALQRARYGREWQMQLRRDPAPWEAAGPQLEDGRAPLLGRSSTSRTPAAPGAFDLQGWFALDCERSSGVPLGWKVEGFDTNRLPPTAPRLNSRPSCEQSPETSQLEAPKAAGRTIIPASRLFSRALYRVSTTVFVRTFLPIANLRKNTPFGNLAPSHELNDTSFVNRPALAMPRAAVPILRPATSNTERS
jgi:hypothetical protein